MEIRIRIPFEKKQGTERAPYLEHFIEHRDLQMRYTRAAVESGVYGQWLSQLTSEELIQFTDENRERILKGLQYKTFGPNLKEQLINRNALYELEIVKRTLSGPMSQDVYDSWEDQYKADLVYWKGKYDVAMQQWHVKKGNYVKQGGSTPFY